MYFTDPVVRTNSGRYVNILKPDPDDILIEDIAHQLSNICRFGGIVNHHYSVAEHSIWVSHQCKNELAGLLHDASEAYLQDIPSPLKKHLPGYMKIEKRFQKVIAKKFGIKYPFPQDVNEADKMALEFEFANYVLDDKNVDLPKRDIKQLFLDRFNELTENG